MKTTTKIKIKEISLPVYSIYRKVYKQYCIKFAKKRMDNIFLRLFGRKINWDNPQDLNEKINWLKFHADLHEWARLADKYVVREFVAQKGLSDILVPLYGHWKSVDEVLDAWDQLPDEFVLKSNNGCGHVLLVTKESGGKNAINLQELRRKLSLWMKETDYGIKYAEFQYQYISNCIIAEKFLRDESISSFSTAPIDYKIYCSNGNPVMCYTAYGRTGTDTGEHKRVGDVYDLQWNQHSEFLVDSIPRKKLDKPINWDKMLQIAKILSEGLPEARVDLYNIEGRIYFGEMTLTSASGFDTEFTSQTIKQLGDNICLDLSTPGNEYYR